MDYLKTFDLDLDKETYYAGETLRGKVVLENSENVRFNGIRLHLRGKAHAEWKISRAGERRTVKQDEHYVDDRQQLWGKLEPRKDGSTSYPILPRGYHTYPFEFKLPESALPCSFESRYCTIRYYLRVTLDIPYASSPQGVKYFTLIGPHIDCMDERLLHPTQAVAKRKECSLCCGKGPLLARGMLERSGYCCGESIRLKVELQNGSDQEAWVRCQLVQHVEFFINKGVLGLVKEVKHVIVEAETERVAPHHSATLHSLIDKLRVPVCPPTMVDVCGLVQIYYCLQMYLESQQEKEAAQVNIPVTIATLPFRIPNTPTPEILYEEASEDVEGGNYISSEFMLGQVYMGEDQDLEMDRTVLYRPLYVTLRGNPWPFSPFAPPSSSSSSSAAAAAAAAVACGAHLPQVPTSGGASASTSTSTSRGGREKKHKGASRGHAHRSRHHRRKEEDVVSRVTRIRLDSSEEYKDYKDYVAYSDQDDVSKDGETPEAERVPLVTRARPPGVSACAAAITATATAIVTSQPLRGVWIGSSDPRDWDGSGTPVEIVDCRLSSV
ncbi:arrestin domain-containing protein 3-like [Babylonia areolata]|uniref:arrestin domain-containing protein 3-like n=1 Tax=Babylonia areolata TaxID=304850 RepID=UPI003FD529E2